MMRFLSSCFMRCSGISCIQWKDIITKPFVTPYKRSFSKTPKTRLVSFVTDIEGCADYLDRFVNISKILSFQIVKPHFNQGESYFPYNKEIIFQQEEDNSVLVFGGDVWDRGGSDLYVIRQLLSLKRRYPNRVYFLMGNRDINKMRIIDEIQYPLQHPGVYWLRGTELRGDPALAHQLEESPADRLRWILSKTMGAPEAFDLRKRELQMEIEVAANNNQVGNRIITDQDVVDSYLKSCHPESGEMGQYLFNANLALRFGGVLFVHGALPIVSSTLDAYHEYNCQENGKLPIETQKARREEFWATFFTIATPWIVSTNRAVPNSDIDRLQSWVQLLNDFCKSQINHWSNYINTKRTARLLQPPEPPWSRDGGYFFNESANIHPERKRNHSRYSFGSIMQYGMGWLPDKNKNPTIVYSSWFNDGMPRKFMTKRHGADASHNDYAKVVSNFFHDFGIDLIVGGHQPLGDVPFPIQVDHGKFILCADTSYSGDTHWTTQDRSKHDADATQNVSHCHGRGTSVSGRGNVAVSEVLIEQCVNSGKVTNLFCHGVLSDGKEYSSVNFLLESKVGKPYEQAGTNGTEWWVKSIFTDDTMLLSHGSGYSVLNSFVNKS